MTGQRKGIARHVVLNIMESLGEDDFVTVLKFSNETKPLVECFTDSYGEPELVQATTENIFEFTEAMNEIEMTEIANMTSALTVAFELLERYRTKRVKVLSKQTEPVHINQPLHQSFFFSAWFRVKPGDHAGD